LFDTVDLLKRKTPDFTLAFIPSK